MFGADVLTDLLKNKLVMQGSLLPESTERDLMTEEEYDKKIEESAEVFKRTKKFLILRYLNWIYLGISILGGLYRNTFIDVKI